ncbi:MAG: SNF2/RAD54 family helicase, partial [Prevotella sp.]|nr:SNF2/RAD54 family helicase [Prevotella sp.]
RINRNDVLVITSNNRDNLFKTIRENFDANYNNKLDDYNIILTTDVLAEGVNLHRANVIVNYDTPWNSTRLMQRIGRVNRIGSSTKHIYNYVFYPSREGNREINLNQIALSKIQTFHSTFGEDNQIYSQDEIVEHDLGKLFDESVERQKEEQNLELPYYEELRSLYHNNRKEYNRIARLSLRSRTGRNTKTVEGVTLSNDTIVFLKTNFRKVFFLVSENAEELSVIDALKYFKADKDETSVKLIEQHYNHVEKALEKFNSIQDAEIQSQETRNTAKTSMGVQVNSAVSLLKDCIRAIDDKDLQLKVRQLKSLVERGVLEDNAIRLQRINKKYKSKSDKTYVTLDDVIDEVIEIVNKNISYYTAEGELQNEQETNAEIIISESFK